MKKNIFHGTALLLLVMGIGAGCTADASGPTVPVAQVVNVVSVEEEVLPRILEFSSVVSGEKETLVAAKVSGRISEISPQIGDEVWANETIVILDSEEESAQLNVANTAYQSAQSNLSNIEALYDEKVDSAEAAMGLIEVNWEASGIDLQNEESISVEKIREAELSIEMLKVQKQNLEEQFIQAEEALYENLRSSIIQVSILTKQSVSYLYQINNTPLGDSRIELNSHFVTDRQDRVVAENSIRDFRTFVLDLEEFYDEFLRAGDVELQTLLEGQSLAKATLDEGKTAIQDMYNVAVNSISNTTITSEMLESYRAQLTSYGGQLESALLGDGNSLIGIDQALESLAVNQTSQRTELEKAIEIAEQNLELLKELSISSEDGKKSNYLVQELAVDQAIEAVELVEAEKDLQIQLAQNAVNDAQGELGVIATQFNKTKLSAPYNGVVAERYLDEGSIVQVGTPILKVVDISTVKLIIYVPEEQIRYLEVGQQGKVTSSSFDGEEFTATVQRIAPTTEENSKKIRVELSLPNENNWLKIGMYMDLSLEVGEEELSTVVPEEAIQSLYGEDFVYVVEEGKVTLRSVTRGLSLEGNVQVFGDLSKEEVIIVKGFSNLREGDAVQVINSEPNESSTIE